jgi:hypothetical protein
MTSRFTCARCDSAQPKPIIAAPVVHRQVTGPVMPERRQSSASTSSTRDCSV